MIPTPEERRRRLAPYKVDMDKLRKFWTTYCVVTPQRDPSKLRCTCGLAAHHGHCVHVYLMEELLGLQRRLGESVALASVGAAAERREESVDEGHDVA